MQVKHLQVSRVYQKACIQYTLLLQSQQGRWQLGGSCLSALPYSMSTCSRATMGEASMDTWHGFQSPAAN